MHKKQRGSATALRSVNFSKGIAELWDARPLSGEVLGPTALIATRLTLVISVIAHLWALPRNLGVANEFIAIQATTVVFLLLLSSSRVVASGRVRLAWVSLVIIAMGTSAHYRNHEVLGALFSLFPVATLLITAFGTRIAFGAVIIIHAVFVAQALHIGEQDLPTILVFTSISLLWSLMVASFVTLLLVRIAEDMQKIGQLLDHERRTLQIISNELRVPAMTLSMLAQRNKPREDDLINMRDAADQMLLVIDNLRSESQQGMVTPARRDLFSVPQLINQLASQLGPVMQRLSIDLVTDIDPSAELMVLGDRFRLRAILSNLVRMTASVSDGYRIWLNVRAEPIDAQAVQLCLDVETNGHAIDRAEFEQRFEGRVTVDEGDMSTLATGLWVARFWVEQLQGELQLFDSPRGGNGFRVLVKLITDSSSLEPQLVSYSERIEEAWVGLTVLLCEPDVDSALEISEGLSEMGFDVADCSETDSLPDLIRKFGPDAAVVVIPSNMPESLAMIDALRAQNAVLPIVAVVEQGELVDILDAGADVVLQRPLKRHDMSSAMRSLVTMGRLRRRS